MKKTNLKKIISLILILVMTLSFVACTTAGDQSEATSSLSPSSSNSDASEEASTDSSINSDISEITSSLDNSVEEPVSDISEASSEDVSSAEPSSESSIESSEAQSEEPSEESSEEESSEENSGDVSTLNPYYGTNIVPTEGKVIAFTFDDGPSYTSSTKKILDKLESLGMKATFFMVGNRVSQDTAPIIKRMVELGCDIGNHSFNHPNFNSMTISEVKKQINDTNARLEKYAGTKATLIRPPYGNMTENQMASLHTPIICWDIDTLDWEFRSNGLKAGKSNSQIAEEIYNHTIKKVHSGGIVLMHDIYDSTAEAFCMLADELVAQGYTLVSISELLGTEKLMCTTKKYGFKW